MRVAVDAQELKIRLGDGLEVNVLAFADSADDIAGGWQHGQEGATGGAESGLDTVEQLGLRRHLN